MDTLWSRLLNPRVCEQFALASNLRAGLGDQ